MAIGLFMCPVVEEPFRGGTRRTPAIAALHREVLAGAPWQAEYIKADFCLMSIEAPEAVLNAVSLLPNVRNVTNIAQEAGIPLDAKEAAEAFDRYSREAWRRRADLRGEG